MLIKSFVILLPLDVMLWIDVDLVHALAVSYLPTFVHKMVTFLPDLLIE